MTPGERPIILFATARPDSVALAGSDLDLIAIPFDSDAAELKQCAVLVVDGERDARQAQRFCKALRSRFGDECPPLLFLAESNIAIVPAFESGADACLGAAWNTEILAAQIHALIRSRESRGRLQAKAEDANLINHRLQAAYEQINLDLDMAGRLQASFLPAHLPEVGKVRFAVHYRRFGRVGGDFYDIFRLDERHVGFLIADVMGHGVPASLVTIYLKKAILPKEIFSDGYRIVPPHEVLTRLNRDLLEQKLAEQPFITMIYGVIDALSGATTLARAAHPHPLLIPAERSPESWKMPGTLLGVFDSRFESQTRTLAPGDKLLLTTDGLMADRADPLSLENSWLLEAVCAVNRLPAADFVEGLAAHLYDEQEPKDDVTLLAVEFLA